MDSLSLKINDEKKIVKVNPETPLLWVLRDTLNLTGTKYGCGIGICGACTVHYGGKAIRACSVKVGDVLEENITTIEGLTKNKKHPIVNAWIEANVPQCGYCQSGQIMAASALLSNNPNPLDNVIETTMSGNICRCGTYNKIKNAINIAIEKSSE